MISNTGIPGFGHNFQSTSPPAIITPANLLGRANTQMTTGAPTPGTIYSTPGTTTSPDTTTTTSAETTTTSTSLPACIYDTLIATNPGFIPCECNGNIVEQTCQEIPGTSCPVVCNRINGPLICPALTNVRKSECSSLSTCDRDSMCAIGSLCCTTHCGQQCVRGVEPPSA
uniref:WAP domain-containing protein n=1 Tax=Ciona savignyi TaxID=51511 RepID=H2ZNQ9_CIOSA